MESFTNNSFFPPQNMIRNSRFTFSSSVVSCWFSLHGIQPQTHPLTPEEEEEGVSQTCPYLPTPSIPWSSPKSASSVEMIQPRQSECGPSLGDGFDYWGVLCRAPGCPLECYHGNCYSETVEVLREDGIVSGLKLCLITDGKSSQFLPERMGEER